MKNEYKKYLTMFEGLKNRGRKPFFKKTEHGQKKIIKENFDSDKSIGSDNEIFKKHMTNLKDLVKSVNIKFEPMTVNYNENEVVWNGTIDSNIKWNYTFNDSNYGFYLTIDNAKMDEPNTLAIHRLSVYFEETWKADMRDKLQNKQL